MGNGNFEESALPNLVEIIFNEIKQNFLQVSAGLRTSTFLSEDRKIFWCGTNGDITGQNVPLEFDYKEKIPEIFSYDNHQIIKLQHTWCNSKSVFYAIVTDASLLKSKMKNPQKMKSILNSLSSEWVGKESKFFLTF